MTIGRSYCIVIQVLRKHDAAVAQSVERRIGSAEVTGPIPVSSSARKERKPLISKALIRMVVENQ